jgi:predicted N-acyltransferase
MEYRIQQVISIHDIGATLWQDMAGTEHPFTRFEFLAALEDSGATTAESGWSPLHLVIEQSQDAEHFEPVGVMPLYVKSHSYGEYVFDWSWADAYHRHGLDYYPKLQTSIPYSPVTGPRLLTQHSPSLLWPAVMSAVQTLCEQHGFSSWHMTFPNEADIKALPDGLVAHLPKRMGSQYHWFNEGFESFDDFLERFSSRKRKNVRKERDKVRQQGVKVEVIEGAEISDALLNTFYQCYELTYYKRGQTPYLEKAFFKEILSTMPEQCVLFAARLGDQTVATAFCFKDRSTLYGRYWGCLDEFDSLHFETCYYTGIEYCIEKGLSRFDPGAQGEHKIQRGFTPIKTWSLHYIHHPGFKDAIEQFTQEEALAMQERIDQLSEHLPFKHTE